MTLAAAPVAFATVFRTIGLVIFAFVVAGYVVYLVINSRQARAEVGSEIELAPNRKPYLDDEQLEGPRLEKVQLWALASLVIVAIGLPLYWVTEPGRQAGARDDFNAKFVSRGASLFAPVGETADALGCAGCHGVDGGGGSANYTLTKPDGTFDRIVSWKAPALNTVLLRYSREEVTYILTYGRPFSPMPAWGTLGGGPLNDQQIQNLVDYLESIQITPEESQQQVDEQLAKMRGAKDANGDPIYSSDGEALFNMGLDDGFAGGAYACGRCHTQGWSYAQTLDELGNPGGGALGPSLRGTTEQFPENPNPEEGESPFQAMIDFVSEGSVNGVRYGVHGQGSGKMPGFGIRPAEPALSWINKGKAREPSGGMLTEEQIAAIVEYERGL